MQQYKTEADIIKNIKKNTNKTEENLLKQFKNKSTNRLNSREKKVKKTISHLQLKFLRTEYFLYNK